MKKLVTIIVTVFRLLFRSGTAWGLNLLVILLSAFIFFSARSDGMLINELQIRIRYGLFFFVGLLNLAMMYIACVSLRKDLDHRHFHMMVAAPVHRVQIWLGKFFGLLAFSAFTFLCGSLALAVATGIFIVRWPNSEERTELRGSFFRAFAQVRPDLPSLEDEVNRRFQIRYQEIKEHHEHECDEDHDHAEHDHDHGEVPEWVIKRELLEDIRRQMQMLSPDSSRAWPFHIRKSMVKGDNLLLRLRFYTEKRKVLVRGKWQLSTPEGDVRWTHEFSAYPYVSHEIEIPAAALPDDGRFEIVFTGENTPYIIFPINEKDGLRLLYDRGGLAANYLRLLLLSLFHLSVLIALALTLASMFSYSVAIFVTLGAYLMSLVANFFTTAMSYQSYGEEGLLQWALRLAVWATQGLKSSSAIESFSDGIFLSLPRLMQEWGINAALYALAVSVIGIIVLTRKEIDKLLQA